jgi:hypothetical protein
MGPARVARRIYAAVGILDHKSGETIVGGQSAVVKVPKKMRSAVTVDSEATISSNRYAGAECDGGRVDRERLRLHLNAVSGGPKDTPILEVATTAAVTIEFIRYRVAEEARFPAHPGPRVVDETMHAHYNGA